MIKIVINLFNKYHVFNIQPENVIFLKNLFPSCNIIEIKSKEDLQNNINDMDIYFGWMIKDEWVRNAKNLKWVHTPAAGIDYIYSPELRNRNITLTVSKGIHAIPMAEHVFATLLYFVRHLDVSLNSSNSNPWCRDELNQLTWRELHSSTMLIVGAGNIAGHVAKIAKAFSMNVIGIRNNDIKQTQYFDNVFTSKELLSALKKADFVVNLLPLTPETNEFFDSKAFSAMKSSSIFLNLGRGGTVSENDLYDALKNGSIYAGAIDVMNIEPFTESHPLYSLSNCLITPHCSAWTEKYMERAVLRFSEQLRAYLDKKQLSFIVDYNKGY